MKVSPSDLFLQCAPVQVVIDTFVSSFSTPRLSATRDAQHVLYSNILRHPVAVNFPLRQSYAIALVKKYLSWVESCLSENTSCEEADDDPYDSDLLDWYTNALAVVSAGNMDKDESDLSFKSFHISNGDADSDYVHCAVTAQFVNVGLSLWPSAFILAELLRLELCDLSHVNNLVRSLAGVKTLSKLKLVELGSGVGLSGLALAKFAKNGFLVSESVECVMTDYQTNIVENMRNNITINGFDVGTACRASTGDCACVLQVDLMDWMEQDENALKWANWSPDIILVADCIYDTSVIDGLCNTIRCGLEHAAVDGDVEPCAIVVQTHRQRTTISQFFCRVSEFANVESFIVKTGVDDVSGPSGRITPELIPVTVDADGMPQHDGEWDCRVSRCIGAFYVDMVELICVHRLRLKSAVG